MDMDDFGYEYRVKTFAWGYFVGLWLYGVGLTLED